MIVLSHRPYSFSFHARKTAANFFITPASIFRQFFLQKSLKCKSRNFQMKAANGCPTDSILKAQRPLNTVLQKILY